MANTPMQGISKLSLPIAFFASFRGPLSIGLGPRSHLSPSGSSLILFIHLVMTSVLIFDESGQFPSAGCQLVADGLARILWAVLVSGFSSRRGCGTFTQTQSLKVLSRAMEKSCCPLKYSLSSIPSAARQCLTGHFDVWVGTRRHTPGAEAPFLLWPEMPGLKPWPT
jgi:hypothetical protein